MISLTCPSCGGNLIINASRTATVCEYCDKHYLIEISPDNEMKIISADTKNESAEPLDYHTTSLSAENGATITLHYCYRFEHNTYTMYVTENNVAFVFLPAYRQSASIYHSMVSDFRYPNAQMKQKTHYYVPELFTDTILEGGSRILVIKRLKHTIPFCCLPSLSPRHVAFIISRLENLACLLEYNSFILQDISFNELFLDPKNHQVCLYGGWQNGIIASSPASRALKFVNGSALSQQGFLKQIRTIGIQILDRDMDLPKPFQDFLSSEPKSSATDDFAYWDQSLLAAYGKREFIALELSERECYSR